MRRLEIAAVIEKPFGATPVRDIIDVYFDTEDEMNHAMITAEGKAIARVLMGNPQVPVEILVLKQDE